MVNDLISKAKLLKWLYALYDGTGAHAEKYAYGRVEQEILSDRFSPDPEPIPDIQKRLAEVEDESANAILSLRAELKEAEKSRQEYRKLADDYRQLADSYATTIMELKAQLAKQGGDAK